LNMSRFGWIEGILVDLGTLLLIEEDFTSLRQNFAGFVENIF
jgi:hypothetical protein